MKKYATVRFKLDVRAAPRVVAALRAIERDALLEQEIRAYPDRRTRIPDRYGDVTTGFDEMGDEAIEEQRKEIRNAIDEWRRERERDGAWEAFNELEIEDQDDLIPDPAHRYRVAFDARDLGWQNDNNHFAEMIRGHFHTDDDREIAARITFDPEHSTFYAYAASREPLEILIDKVEAWLSSLQRAG